MPVDEKSEPPKPIKVATADSVIRLDDQSENVGNVSEKEAWARVLSINADTVSRLIMVAVIAGIFIGLNYAVMSFIKIAFDTDVAQMAGNPPLKPVDRLVTTQVLVSLIGATVVQVGVAVIAIVSYLFPKHK
jgi:hypothetical protein